MLLIATVAIMLACGWAQYRNGLFSACAMLISVFIAGLVAFGFFEPIANMLEPVFQENALAGTEDMIALTLLFSVTLGALRVAANTLAPDLIEQNGILQYFGGAAVGVVTGYFVAAFLICTMQTLPLDERFLGFEPRSSSEPFYRTFFPGDRVWLSLMRHAGAAPLAWKEDPDAVGTPVDRFQTFDPKGTFELRYLRYRRSTESRGPMPYFGEFERELGKKKL
jgi:uncharacterized membrane protein required for colicin V production